MERAGPRSVAVDACIEVGHLHPNLARHLAYQSEILYLIAREKGITAPMPPDTSEDWLSDFVEFSTPDNSRPDSIEFAQSMGVAYQII